MVLNEYMAIMWSMEGDHSTAVRPHKSPLKRGFQRCFLTHSLATEPKTVAQDPVVTKPRKVRLSREPEEMTVF